jgi:hypothetical protein
MKRTFADIGGAVILGAVVILVLVVGAWAITVAWAPWKGAGDVRKQTQGNASFRIASYNHFYDLCGQARTLQQNARITRVEIRKATTPDERYRQETNLQAQRNQLNELVNTYNQDARKTGTSGQFKASDLPFSLNTHQEISCTA